MKCPKCSYEFCERTFENGGKVVCPKCGEQLTVLLENEEEKKSKKTSQHAFFIKFLLLFGISLLVAFGGKLYEIIFTKINENEFKGE